MKKFSALLAIGLFAAAGYAAQQTINIGSSANDGTGDTLRGAFIKVNDNFTELYNKHTGDLDMGGNNITNVNQLTLSSLTVTNATFDEVIMTNLTVTTMNVDTVTATNGVFDAVTMGTVTANDLLTPIGGSLSLSGTNYVWDASLTNNSTVTIALSANSGLLVTNITEGFNGRLIVMCSGGDYTIVAHPDYLGVGMDDYSQLFTNNTVGIMSVFCKGDTANTNVLVGGNWTK